MSRDEERNLLRQAWTKLGDTPDGTSLTDAERELLRKVHARLEADPNVPEPSDLPSLTSAEQWALDHGRDLTIHPMDEELEDYHDGKLNPSEAAKIASHLTGCVDCREGLRLALEWREARTALHEADRPRSIRSRRARLTPVLSWGGPVFAGVILCLVLWRVSGRVRNGINPVRVANTATVQDGSIPLIWTSAGMQFGQTNLVPPEYRGLLQNDRAFPELSPYVGVPGQTAGPKQSPDLHVPTLLTPVGTVLVDPPAFSWKHPDGIDIIGYTVAYWPVDPEGELPLSEPVEIPVTASRTTLPLTNNLKPGLYYWRVRAEGISPKGHITLLSRTARFIVLAPECRHSHVMLGLAYARVGQVELAIQNLTAFSEEQRQRGNARFADRTTLLAKRIAERDHGKHDASPGVKDRTQSP